MKSGGFPDPLFADQSSCLGPQTDGAGNAWRKTRVLCHQRSFPRCPQNITLKWNDTKKWEISNWVTNLSSVAVSSATYAPRVSRIVSSWSKYDKSKEKALKRGENTLDETFYCDFPYLLFFQYFLTFQNFLFFSTILLQFSIIFQNELFNFHTFQSWYRHICFEKIVNSVDDKTTSPDQKPSPHLHRKTICSVSKSSAKLTGTIE